MSNIASDFLSAGTQSAIKTAVRDYISGLPTGEPIDFEKVAKSVINTLIIKSGNYVFSDKISNSRYLDSLFKFVNGKSCINAVDYDSLGLKNSTKVTDIYNSFKFAESITYLTEQCSSLGNAHDQRYYAQLEIICDSFLSLANSMAGALPLVGDIVRDMLAVAGAAFKKQYDIIVESVADTNTQMAELALYYNLTDAAIYLLAQPNLIFDEEKLITMALSHSTDSFSSYDLSLMYCVSENHDELLSYLSDYYDISTSADEIRTECKDLLTKELGYDFTGCTDQQITDYFSGKHTYESGIVIMDNITKNVSSFNGAESLYINYDPIVIDMGKTDFELTSIENGVNFDMDVNNTPFIFHRI